MTDPSPHFAESQVMKRIAEQYPQMSDRNRRVASLVMRHPLQAATMTIVQLAEAAEISTATANRFVKTLGFEGYSDFRSALVASLTETPNQAERLRKSRQEGATVPDVVRRTLHEDLSSLEATLGGLTDEAATRAIDLICSANRIFTLGFGSSAYLAGFADYRLQAFCEDVRCVSGEGGTEETARRLFRASKGDLLIVYCFPRYSQDALDMAMLGRERGADVLGITDSPSSPLTPNCTVSLHASASRQVLITSSVSALALTDALACGAAHRREQALADYGRLTDHISKYVLPVAPGRRFQGR